MKKGIIPSALTILGMILVAVGVVLPLFTSLQFVVFRYIFCAGAALVLISRLFSRYDGDNLRIKRLHRLEFWSALLYCVAGFFLFYDHGTFQEALAFTLAGAAIQIYVTIMLPITEKSDSTTDNKGKNDNGGNNDKIEKNKREGKNK